MLGKKLKAQTDISTKNYEGLSTFFKYDEREEPILKNYDKLDLMYKNKYSFYKYYCDSKKFYNPSLKSKYYFLAEFLNDLYKFK